MSDHVEISYSFNSIEISFFLFNKKWFFFRETKLMKFQVIRSSRPAVFFKKGVLRNFAEITGKHLRQSLFLMKLQSWACKFIKKETLAQVFSCEFAKFLRTPFFYRTPLVAASE